MLAFFTGLLCLGEKSKRADKASINEGTWSCKIYNILLFHLKNDDILISILKRATAY
jgi:hypothetical protein